MGCGLHCLTGIVVNNMCGVTWEGEGVESDEWGCVEVRDTALLPIF